MAPAIDSVGGGCRNSGRTGTNNDSGPVACASPEIRDSYGVRCASLSVESCTVWQNAGPLDHRIPRIAVNHPAMQVLRCFMSSPCTHQCGSTFRGDKSRHGVSGKMMASYFPAVCQFRFQNSAVVRLQPRPLFASQQIAELRQPFELPAS